jgi:hypothetical protein
MRIWPLFFCLAVAPLGAAEWQTSADIAGLEPLPAPDRSRVAAVVQHAHVAYALEDTTIGWRLHRGDLKIIGSFDNDAAVIVDGNLEIAGSYDDYLSGSPGLLIVLGDMKAEHVLTWGDLYVRGRLTARGLVYGYYNDFALTVGGGIDARGIVISDHSADYEAGASGFTLDDAGNFDDADLEAALRQLEPDILTDPDELELDESSDLWSLWPAYGIVADRVRTGRPVFRGQAAAPGLIDDLRIALAADSSAEKLLALVGRDPLLDRVLAARPELEEPLIDALLARRDPGVNAWLARVVTNFEALADTLTAQVAEQIVANPDSPESILMKIAAAKEPEVRATLILRPDLPPAIVARIAQDPDPAVRAEILGRYDNVDRLPAAEQTRLARDPDPRVRTALAHANLDAPTLALFADDPAKEVRSALAINLATRIDRPRARAGQVEREKLALALFEKGDDGLASEVFVALSADRQAEIYRSGRRLDWPTIAETTRSLPLMQALVASDSLEVLGQLATNLALSQDLQAKILERAPRLPPCDGCWRHETFADVIAALLGNDDVAPLVLDAVTSQVLAAHDAELFDALTSSRAMPQETIARLDARYAGGEDWSLAVILMHHANRRQLERALPRWYEDDGVRKALAKLRSLDDSAWFRALAASPVLELRRTAAWNANTPPELVAELLNDQDEEVAVNACANPALPASALANKGPEIVIACASTSLETLERLIDEAPTGDLRQKAFEAYRLRKLRAW